jgi:hypothetical protein
MRNIDSPMLDGAIRYYYGLFYNGSVESVIHRNLRTIPTFWNKNSVPKYKYHKKY